MLVSDSENQVSIRCATQVVTLTTGMGIITPDIIMDTDTPGEDAAALVPITGPTAAKTNAENADKN